MTQRSVLPKLLLAIAGTMTLGACEPSAPDLGPNSDNSDKADGLTCEQARDCGSRDIEVIFTNPFCDECSGAEKNLLLAESKIIARVIQLVDGAQERIDVAQFTFSRRQIEEALVRAHERGVTIRIAMDSAQSRDGSLSRRLQDAGLDVRFIKGKEVNATRHGIMHTKYMLVDDTTLLTGSNN